MKQQNANSSPNAFGKHCDTSTRPGRRRLRRFLAAAAIIATAPALMASAEERVAAYTVYDLGTLGGDTSRARGINDDGDVVGTADNSSGNPRAFIYYSGTMYDLNSKLTFMPSRPPTMECAYDINEDSRIVGGDDVHLGSFTSSAPYHNFFVTGSEAFALDPDGALWDYYDLGVLTSGDADGDSGVAFALNDDATEPVVVGTFNTTIDGSCDPFDDVVNRGAYVDFFDDVPTALEPVDNDSNGDAMSYAMDINNSDRIGGWTGECPLGVMGALADNDANIWDSTDVALKEVAGELLGNHVRGVDDGDDASVGFGVSFDDPTYSWFPLYWPQVNTSSAPHNLISIASDDSSYPLFEDAESGLANAINNNDLQQVVGAVWEDGSFSTKYATVWTKCVSAQFVTWYATDLTAASEATSNGWVRLAEATAINDNGWIVGYGLKDMDPAADQYHAFLLIPRDDPDPYDPCP